MKSTSGAVSGKDRARLLREMRAKEASSAAPPARTIVGVPHNKSTSSSISSLSSSAAQPQRALPASFFDSDDAPPLTAGAGTAAIQSISDRQSLIPATTPLLSTAVGNSKYKSIDKDNDIEMQNNGQGSGADNWVDSQPTKRPKTQISSSSVLASKLSQSTSSLPAGFFEDPVEDLLVRGIDPVALLAEQDKQDEREMRALFEEVGDDAIGDVIGDEYDEDNVGINRSEREDAISRRDAGVASTSSSVLDDELVQLSYLSRIAHLANQASSLVKAGDKDNSSNTISDVNSQGMSAEVENARLVQRIQENTAILTKLSSLRDDDEEEGIASFVSSVFSSARAKSSSNSSSSSSSQDLDLDCYG